MNIQEQVHVGVFLETPHYSAIELAAMNLGRGWYASLVTTDCLMGLAHTATYYYYGLIVGGNVIGEGDIYGVDL